jgi:multidrug efflux pump subunit AcrA (membrane-fusion protein)
MKKNLWPTLPLFAIILALIVSPIAAARAQGGAIVTASATIEPAHVAHLGFLSSALLKDISVKEGDVVQAGQTLASLNTPDLEFNVSAAEAGLRSAQSFAELQRYGGSRSFSGGKFVYNAPPGELIKKADLLVDQARGTLDIARAALAQSTLLAPFAGTVTDIPVLPGQLVQLGDPVITIATLDQLQIETTDLAERDIAKIKVGQKATVYIDALGAEFPATVTAVAPRAEKVGGDVVFKITLTFDQQPQGLLWGMTAEVKIATE